MASPPIVLRVNPGKPAEMDVQKREITFTATHPFLTDVYHVKIPVAALKQVVGQLITHEGGTEAKARSAT